VDDNLIATLRVFQSWYPIFWTAELAVLRHGVTSMWKLRGGL